MYNTENLQSISTTKNADLYGVVVHIFARGGGADGEPVHGAAPLALVQLGLGGVLRDTAVQRGRGLGRTGDPFVHQKRAHFDLVLAPCAGLRRL